MSFDTPVMVQYKRIKSQHPDSILFFRLGDFYEMFESDAKEVSSILDIVLTKRHNIPMCGVPYHAASSYIAKLLKAGKKIAICEQLSSTPQKGLKIVEREVVEIITPGTIVNEDYLENKKNNYLTAIGKVKNIISMAYVDISTGEFSAISFASESGMLEENVSRELLKISPSEIIIQESLLETNSGIKKIISEYGNITINRYPDWYFNIENSLEALKKHFNVTTLKGFGIDDNSPEIVCAGIIIDYLRENSGSLLSHITNIEIIAKNNRLEIDGKTIKNLEIIRNMNDSSSKYTLLSILDYTRTSMGGRMIKKWLQNPLNDISLINARLDNVEFFYKNQLLLTKIRSYLSQLNDLERFTSKLALDKVNAKDLLGLKNTVMVFNEIAQTISQYSGSSLFPFFSDTLITDAANRIMENLEKSIYDDPPVILTEGNLIKNGYNSELDSLRDIRDNSQEILDRYIETEKENSGITNLKIRYNKIIGYFLEVTKSYIDQVPDHFIRRQSLVGAERYTTQQLGTLENELNSAAEKISSLEKELFMEIKDSLKKHIPLFRNIAENLAVIDCLQSYSYSATVHGYTRPTLNNSTSIFIKNGRHPVVEANLPQGEFIPNDVSLDRKKTFILLTGPNMAGKSTFLRQTAQIVLMAQSGAFVPSDSAEIGLIDKLFCRVGASDNLARGESTFLVEMSETSYILRAATDKSLIIMDEVGRGTGTKDGLSIARSICEYIIKKIRAKTLFATHYHELVNLDMPEIENLSMNAVEKDGKLVFLKKIKKGPANKSYGINVAEIAGIPYSVILRAEELLETYEKTTSFEGNSDPVKKLNLPEIQNQLFSEEHIVSREITAVDIDKTTPVEALNYINTWQKRLK
ncbi:MAG: DNA mismatch repair protein MutS [Spirochaetia bacterium]|jgi:DNA mismatch repair protein MutS|nr:DNA mismatch repair protein MutS [Spirochaetia bacterium]